MTELGGGVKLRLSGAVYESKPVWTRSTSKPGCAGVPVRSPSSTPAKVGHRPAEEPAAGDLLGVVALR